LRTPIEVKQDALKPKALKNTLNSINSIKSLKELENVENKNENKNKDMIIKECKPVIPKEEFNQQQIDNELFAKDYTIVTKSELPYVKQ